MYQGLRMVPVHPDYSEVQFQYSDLGDSEIVTQVYDLNMRGLTISTI